jgi:hypothetical protein
MKSAAEIYFEEIEQMYKSGKQRKAFAYPEWIYELENTEENRAKKALKGFKAFILMLLDQNKKFGKHYWNLSQIAPDSLADKSTFIRVIASAQDEPAEYISNLEDLDEFIRFEHEQLLNRLSKSSHCTYADLNELVIESMDRNARVCVPEDIAGIMQILSEDDELVDVYSKNGVGLMSALRARDECSVSLVGTENKEEGIAYQNNHSYVEKLVQRIEKKWTADLKKSKCLLVNALNENLPIYPPTRNEETDRTTEGTFNNIFNLPNYEKIVMLVSNSVLSANRGEIKAQDIFDFCVKKGLTKVVQLPAGAVGPMNTEDTILVFEKNKKNEEIQFVVMGAADYAKKKFGLPRRASEYPKSLFELKNILNKSKYKSLKYLEIENKNKNENKFSSFQASRFINDGLISESKSKLEMKRLGELFEIIRAQHISKFGRETIFVEEISSSDIDETGLVHAGQVKELSQEDVYKYKKQILKENDLVICFRGAPDSVGKVGLYIHKGEKVLPNQSFMILRPKAENSQSKELSRIIFWWLRTEASKIQLRQRSLSPGVLRLTPYEIKQFLVPVGPNWYLNECNAQFIIWQEKITQYENLKLEAKHIEMSAINQNKIKEVKAIYE